MNHQPQPTDGLVEVHIVHVTKSGDAFGATRDGENVYIPPSLVAKFNVATGQMRQLKISPNSPEHVERGVAWRAYFIQPEADAAADERQLQLPLVYGGQPVPKLDPSVDEIVWGWLNDNGAATTKAVARFLGVDTIPARRLLDKLHHNKRVVRADVHVGPAQIKASRAVWAVDEADFYRPAMRGGE